MQICHLHQWPADLAHGAILQLALLCQIYDRDHRGGVKPLETYIEQIQVSWLKEMPPSGSG